MKLLYVDEGGRVLADLAGAGPVPRERDGVEIDQKRWQVARVVWRPYQEAVFVELWRPESTRERVEEQRASRNFADLLRTRLVDPPAGLRLSSEEAKRVIDLLDPAGGGAD